MCVAVLVRLSKDLGCCVLRSAELTDLKYLRVTNLVTEKVTTRDDDTEIGVAGSKGLL